MTLIAVSAYGPSKLIGRLVGEFGSRAGPSCSTNIAPSVAAGGKREKITDAGSATIVS